MSSMRQSTPGSHSSIIDIRRWNNSGALVIPKGSLLKQYLPYGVINVVRRRDSALSALFTSNLLKRVPPVSCARVSSTWGIGNVSQRTFSFRGFKSTHILTSPDRFGTTTMPACTPLCDYPHHLHSIEFVSNLFTEWESDMTWCVQRVWHGIGFQLNGVLLTYVAEPLKHFWEVLDDVVLACTLGDSVHWTEQFEGDQSW